MKTTIERIEAGKLLPPEQLSRLGLAPRRMVRVVLETLDDLEDTAGDSGAFGATPRSKKDILAAFDRTTENLRRNPASETVGMSDDEVEEWANRMVDDARQVSRTV